MKDNKAIENKSCGIFDFRYDSANKVLVVRWNDNNVVTLASNCQLDRPVGSSKCSIYLKHHL